MSETVPTTGHERHFGPHRLIILSLIATSISYCIATFNPSGRAVDATTQLSFGAAYGWIAAQSYALTVPGLVIGLLLARFFPRVGTLVGAALILLMPTLVLCDVITFSWIAERFLSSTMYRIVTALLPSLMVHVSGGMVIFGVVSLLGSLLMLGIAWWLSGIVARRWSAAADAVHPLAASLLASCVATGIAVPALWNLQRTTDEMREHSTRHPLCALHVVGYRGVGVAPPIGTEKTMSRLHGLELARSVIAREHRQRFLGVNHNLLADQRRDPLPDVLVVVIESFRSEVIDEEVMPNVWQYARRGLNCRSHFSSCNSTNQGMFSLINGLEAAWFQRPVRYSPIMNRLFREAGYELGFFGGHDDWRMFYMDGFINEEKFDTFYVEPMIWLESDKRCSKRAAEFLDRDDLAGTPDDSPRKPRLAILYLFSTHGDYRSDPQDQIFFPMAEDDYFVPFTAEKRPEIWNRYKNSARTVDRLLSQVMREDRVTIITGDHGEAFLEDGICGHGLRISQYQNMTPAVIYAPGLEPRVIDAHTMHADLLPTLLSITGIPITEPEVFDGHDLSTIDDDALSQRIFMTRNYMNDDMAIVGPWTLDPSKPFGYRCLLSLGDWQVAALNPINEVGLQISEASAASQTEPTTTSVLQQWLRLRFGERAIAGDEGMLELLAKHLNADHKEIQLAALRIAGDIEQPDAQLIEMIVHAARSDDADVRNKASEVVVRLQRRVGAE